MDQPDVSRTRRATAALTGGDRVRFGIEYAARQDAIGYALVMLRKAHGDWPYSDTCEKCHTIAELEQMQEDA